VPFEAPLPSDTRIFVVDDDPAIAMTLEKFLVRAGYQVTAFTHPKEALGAIEADPPEILLTDHNMPDMKGLELAEAAQEVDPDIHVIMITGESYAAAVAESLRMRLDEFLTKPLDLPVLDKAITRAVQRRAQELYHRALHRWMHEELDRRSLEIERMSVGTLEALMIALEARSEHFRGHSRAVARYAHAVAEAIGLPPEDLREIRIAGLLHDVGMIGVPDRIVEKPDTLDPEEFEILRRHCETGARILAPLRHLDTVARYILEHHERLDGSGYPARKKGDEISMGGAVVGLAEMYTALLETRPYRDAVSRVNAFRTLEAAAGKWFPEELIQALMEEVVKQED
jgi:putative two-component system response regulator